MKSKYILILLLCGLFLIPLASAAPILTLEANPTNVTADGVSYSKIKAALKDGSVPFNGSYITFSIGDKSLRVKTNSLGTATIRTGPSLSIQNVTVVVNASTPSGNLTNKVTVYFVNSTPDSIHLYSSPSSVGTNITRNYTSTIVAKVLDKYRNPVLHQQVNFNTSLRKADGSVSHDFTLNHNGTVDNNGNITITTDNQGSATLTFIARNTSGTTNITATVGNLTANSTLKIMGESYLLVETKVEPEIIDPPAIVNVAISVKGCGEEFEGGTPVDAMLVTDVSSSMYEYSEYEFRARGTVPAKNGSVNGQWNTTFNLNEAVNHLDFTLNNKSLTLRLISPNKTIYNQQSGYDIESNIDFIEQGNWTIEINNSNPYPINFNLTSNTSKLSATKVASKAFNALLNPTYHRVGLEPFPEDTNTHQFRRLTYNITDINSIINSLIAAGQTPTASAIKKATDELKLWGRQDVLRYIILLSDGLPNVCNNRSPCDSDAAAADAIDEANAAKALGIRIYAIGIGVNANETFMKNIASNDSYYFAANASQLKEIYENIGEQITNISAKNASLSMSLSNGLNYSANAAYVLNSSNQTYITSDNITIDYGCGRNGSNACEPNSTSPLHWDIKIPSYPPDNKTIKIGDRWILKFQLNLSNDGMLFNLDKSIVEYMNFTGGNLSINVPGAQVFKNATPLQPKGLNVSKVILAASKSRVRPDGVSKSTLSATVLDEEDNLVPDGTEVKFHTNLGSFSKDSIAAEYSTETVGGIATAKIYSIVAGTADIYAESKAEFQQNYVLSNNEKVTFTYSRIITIS